MKSWRHTLAAPLLVSTLVLGGCPSTGEPVNRELRFHRLNRAEYNNSIRDLLGISLRPADDFPADDPSLGFDNNAATLSLSPLLVELYERAAEDVAAAALDPEQPTRAQLLACNPESDPVETCVRALIDELAPRAWRRPLADEEVDALLALADGETLDTRASLVIQAIFLSPNFLFRVEEVASSDSEELEPLGGHELATRLAYFLWSSTPDDELLHAAASGALADPTALESQVRRMLADPRANALIANFGGQWLSFRALDNVFKDASRYPRFDAELRESMRQEAQLFFGDFVVQDRDLRQLLTREQSFVDHRLADLYGVPDPGPGFVSVDLSGAQRGGILTQAAFLAVQSYPFTTSPARRGRWVLDNLLCQPPAPAPDGVDVPLDPMAGTKRDELAQHRLNPACASCHERLDPLGLAFETYDAIGAYREFENDAAIDASGALPDGQEFANAQELSSLLAADPQVVTCIIDQVFVYALGRAIGPEDREALDGMVELLGERGYGARELFVVVATSEVFRSRTREGM
ncbi:MAG: DUF1592 domain-containing protein [Nannocystaceae bacterium]